MKTLNDKVKWDKRFLELAKVVAQWSKDPSTKVGAVITRGNRVVSLGYNGFAAGVDDDPKRYTNREFKLVAILHAEVNAIMFSHEENLHGCTIYTWPMPPCSRCAAQIIQVGINQIVSVKPTPELKYRWGKDFRIANLMYENARVKLCFLDME